MPDRIDIFPLVDMLREQLTDDHLNADEYLFLKNLLIRNWKQALSTPSDDPGEQQIALEQIEDILAKITNQYEYSFPDHATQRDVVDHLYSVGTDKPLGCIAQAFLPENKQEREAITDSLEAKGLKILWLSAEESAYVGGALYAYHPDALSRVLAHGTPVLTEANWPTEPEAFIRKLRDSAKKRTPLFDLICDAFGDQHNYGHTKFIKEGRQ